MRRAYVTLVTNADFALGAAALLRSLALSGTNAERIVMHTGGVPDAALTRLKDRGATLVPVDLLPTSEAFNQRHARKALHDVMTATRTGNSVLRTSITGCTLPATLTSRSAGAREAVGTLSRSTAETKTRWFSA